MNTKQLEFAFVEIDPKELEEVQGGIAPIVAGFALGVAAFLLAGDSRN